MAVSSDAARVVHTANGVATFFSYAPMDGVTSSNLKVYLFNPTTGVLTPQTLGTHYSFGGGGVTFFTAPPAGRRVILARIVDLLQPDIYKTNAPFPAVVTENRFDEIVKGLQQINDIVQNRAIILPLGDAGFSTNSLPAVEGRKGRVLYFNATTGDPEAQLLANTVLVIPTWAQSFLSQPTSAAGLTNIGAVAKAGDTMTGALTLPGAPTATNHASTKGYVDTKVATDAVQKAGDTMTGALTLPGAPTATNHASTKGYVDTEVGTRVAKAGDTMTGDLWIDKANAQLRLRHSTPTSRFILCSTAANARWAFGADGATESGGNAGSDYVINRYSDAGAFLSTPFKITRANAQITFTSPQPIEGPSATPTAANHLATKGYVDSVISAGPYVLKAGDTMTGPLTLPGAPTATNHAANRGYVNDQLPISQTSVHSNGWTGIFDLTTSYTDFFDIMLADNIWRIHVTCWYSIGQQGGAGTQIDYDLRCLLLDSTLNVVANNNLAYGRVRATTGAIPMFANGGGSAVFDGITPPNSGWRVRFQGRKLVAAGPFEIYNYIGNIYCARRPSP